MVSQRPALTQILLPSRPLSQTQRRQIQQPLHAQLLSMDIQSPDQQSALTRLLPQGRKHRSRRRSIHQKRGRQDRKGNGNIRDNGPGRHPRRGSRILADIPEKFQIQHLQHIHPPESNDRLSILPGTGKPRLVHKIINRVQQPRTLYHCPLLHHTSRNTLQLRLRLRIHP